MADGCEPRHLVDHPGAAPPAAPPPAGTGTNPAQSAHGSGAQSLAEALKPFLELTADLTLGQMLDQVESGDGPGPVLFILTLPVLLPLPPGFSMVLAAPLLLIAPQIIFGRRRLWLPRFFRRRNVKRQALEKLVHRVLPWVERAETLVKPRLGFLTGRIGTAVVGVACSIIALVLVLPIPFANLVPAIAMGVFAIGLTRKDGLCILAGYALMVAAALVVDLGVHGFSLGFHRLRAWL